MIRLEGSTPLPGPNSNNVIMKKLLSVIKCTLVAIAAVALIASTGFGPEWSGLTQFFYTVGCMLVVAICAKLITIIDKYNTI